MHRKTLIALIGAIVIAVAATGAALAASAGPAVNVQIKTLTRTLKNVVVHGETGWITKGGTPKGVCSGKSGAGALDAATHGKWGGTYFSSLKDIEVTSILGVKPKKPYFWLIYVNGKMASTGVCGIKLHAGEKILFKVHK